MAFHPQSDGLLEIPNMHVTHYLHAFATHHQDKWDTILPLAEWVYSRSTHSATDRSSFELHWELTPSIPAGLVAGKLQPDKLYSMNGAAFVEQLQASLLDTQNRLWAAQDGQRAEVNWSRRPCTLEVGDLVFSSTRVLLIIYTNYSPSWQKLQHLSAGPYKTITFFGPSTVELELTEDMNIRHALNVSRLKKFTTDWAWQKPPPPPIRTVWDTDGTIQHSYFVEAITLH